MFQLPPSCAVPPFCCRPFALSSPFCFIFSPFPPTVRLLLLPLTVTQANIGSERSNSASVPCPPNRSTNLGSRLANTLYKRHSDCCSTKPPFGEHLLRSIRTEISSFLPFYVLLLCFFFSFSLCSRRITTLHPHHAFPLCALSRTSHRIAHRRRRREATAATRLSCVFCVYKN